MDIKKALIGTMVVAALAVGGGVAYASNAPGTAAGDEEASGIRDDSVTVPRQDGPSLQELAKMDRAAAEEAALDAVPGTVKETDLEAENGFVVYGVEVAGNEGKTHDVKVDAGNAKILHQQVDGVDGPGDTEDAD